MERDATLRHMLVRHLERTGVLHDPAVAAALRTVPRHRFVPGVPLEDAYADRALAIKTSGEEILSSISQPGMIAQMLELLGPRPGDHILEIGTGSGYNAALLAAMTGEAGSVTTIDLEPELAAAAQRRLDELGIGNVRVLAGDGGARDFAATPYDRVVVTARTDDVAPAWWEALREGARLVVPLRLDGAGEYAVGFSLRGRRLESVGVQPCAFIALRGESAVAAESTLFFRDSLQRERLSAGRRVAHVTAIRRSDAEPELLAQADAVIARPFSLLALEFV